MVTLCSVGHKSGTKCEHKRNIDGVFVCAIGADKNKCCFAVTEAEYNEKMTNAMKKAKEVQ